MSKDAAETIAHLEKLVREAGEKLLELWPGRKSGRELQIKRKPDGSMVTEADLASHEIVTTGLKKLFPDDYIFSEEAANFGEYGRAETSWILDPLDGTEIYSRGENYFAIFLARRKGKEITEGVMYYPALGNLFSAVRGEGAALNGAPLRVSKNEKLKSRSVFVEGVSLAPAPYLCDSNQYRVGTSAFGALCKGELDGVLVRFSSGTFYPWDFAPGALIIEESGGRVTDENGAPILQNYCPVNCRYMVASNSILHDKVRGIVPK